MHKYFLFWLSCGWVFFGPGSFAQDLTNSVKDIAAQKPVLQGTSWAAVAQYTNGQSIFSIEPNLRLAPASTLKLLTSAAALETFGPAYRFQTQLYTDTPPDASGTVQGNLYIRGGGDPTLGSSRVPGSLSWDKLLQQWSKQLQAAGIRHIQGNIYADSSLFTGLSLSDKTNWQNMGNYFAAPVTALALNDNSFAITFSAQSKHDGPMHVKEISPLIEGLQIHSFVTADAKNARDNAYVYAAPGQYNLEIYGTLPASYVKDYTIRAALPDAPQLTADLLQEQLERDGISISGTTRVLEQAPDYTGKHLLLTHLSPPLKDIIYILNKRSFNFYAEAMLRHLAIHAGKPGTLQNGIDALLQFLKQHHIDTTNVLIYDGSGLSRDNQITAQVLLDILLYMANSPYFDVYYNSLATLDDRGDLLLLTRLMKPLKRTQDIHVKGGTIDGVKAQAGYAKDKNGQLIAFAFITNNIIAKDESINRFYEDLLKLLLQHE